MPKHSRAVSLLSCVVIAVGAAACSHGASSPSAVPTSQSPAGGVPPPPQVGQCRNATATHLEAFQGRPVAHGVHADDWVDKTPPTDCSRIHTLETVEVTELAEKPTLALVKQLGDSCPSTAGLGYLGISFPRFRTLEFVVFWPSRAQRAAGQRWVRCDVGVRANTACCQLAPQAHSLRGAVDSDPVRFYMCLNQVPDPSRSQPLTSCKRPHRGELLPDTLEDAVTHYPSAATLDRKGRSGCAKFIAHRENRSNLVITAFWRPDEPDWSGQPLEGFCFVHAKTGLIPPDT